MRRLRRGGSALAIFAAALTATALTVPAQAAAQHHQGNASGKGSAAHYVHGKGKMSHGRYAPMHGRNVAADCASKPTTDHVACEAKVHAYNTSGRTGPQLMTAATGLGPADIESAYGLTGQSGAGRTVAIVDAFDDPKAEADLAAYRSHFGLPACTTANGCFKKVGQTGSTTSLPKTDYGWSLEISLDLDMVSATCPSCHILLVESSSANFSDIVTAENTAAATPGVVSISNSYGGTEDGTEASIDSAYDHPGIAITASTGDNGYGASYPATSPHVTAVGGTSLTKSTATSRGWTESAWSGAGSGCSKALPQPAFQNGLSSCTTRATADVSAVADPNTGLAIYDTANSCGSGTLCDLLIELGLVSGSDGWVQVGGTSASSPIIASVYALAGNTGSIDNSYPYSHTSSLWDVTSGSNGSCGGSNLCTAGPGWDGPTGLGTPNGVGAF
ncbi:MAG: S53 family peptidase [Nocardioidaceae bacterium]|nr:S53 family peptidase [Nocardioidaceae bacterium]MCL2613662.1 S53 family peptidase [Nocardioidaceae bacterium]